MIILSPIFGVLIPFIETVYLGPLPLDYLVFSGNAVLSVMLAYFVGKTTLSLRDTGRYQS